MHFLQVNLIFHWHIAFIVFPEFLQLNREIILQKSHISRKTLIRIARYFSYGINKFFSYEIYQRKREGKVDIPASLPPSSHVCDSQDCGISGLPELGTATRTK